MLEAVYQPVPDQEKSTTPELGKANLTPALSLSLLHIKFALPQVLQVPFNGSCCLASTSAQVQSAST